MGLAGAGGPARRRVCASMGLQVSGEWGCERWQSQRIVWKWGESMEMKSERWVFGCEWVKTR